MRHPLLVTNDGTTPLMVAAGLTWGWNDLGVTPLVLACENGSAALVTALLEESADPNTATSMGETALMACARGGDVDAVAALLDRGAALDAGESSRGQTALMWAAAHRHPDVVRVLIAHGADVHACALEGEPSARSHQRLRERSVSPRYGRDADGWFYPVVVCGPAR